MDKFEIGEIAIYRNLDRNQAWNGEECEIVRSLGYHKDTSNPYSLTYVVRDSLKLWTVYPHQLMKKRPPNEPGSWEDSLWDGLGWNPTKQTIASCNEGE